MAKTNARKFTDETVINVINNTKGNLYFKTKDNDEYDWELTDDSFEMKFAHLKEMKRNHKTFFVEQWVRFSDEDSDVLKELGLEQYYTNFLTRDDIEELLKLSDEELLAQFDLLLSNKTKNAESLIVKVAREKYAAKELTNSYVIDLLEERFKTEIKS